MAAVSSPGSEARRDEALPSCAATPVSAPDPGADKEGAAGQSKQPADGAENETSVKWQSEAVGDARSPLVHLTEAEAEAQGERAWSGPEGDAREPGAPREGDAAPEVRRNISSEPTPGRAQESVPGVEEAPPPSKEQDWGAAGPSKELEGKESDVTQGEMQVKQRKSRLVCRECGKRFTRREMFNLHRHFHTHQDELASLTCKDCGLTFQHRSSLIKHRSEHKEKTLLPGQEKRSHGREGRSLQCEHCAETFPTLGKLRCHPCRQAPEKPYRCPLCRREFQYRVSVNAHMQTHSLDTPFRCLECSKGFPCGWTLRIHQRSHAALKPFECPDCGMVFRHRSVMEDHRRRHTQERTHQCNLCGKGFKYDSLLHQHQFLHTGRKPFRCPDCGKTFAFAQNLRTHRRQHRKRTHCCPCCSLSFLDPTSLQTHMLSHGRAEVSGSRASAKRSGVQRINSCPLCPLTLPDVSSLKAHMLIHEADEEFGGRGRGPSSNGVSRDMGVACLHFPLTLPDQRSFQMHMLSHTSLQQGLNALGRAAVNNSLEILEGNSVDALNRRMLKCEECGKTFRHRSVLELHMRIHSRDKPFQCKVCGKAFKFSSYLQQHLIIHTGQKPFKCPECGKDFAFLQNMKTHQRLHQQKPYRCTQCRKGYSEEGELQRHMLSHTGDKPHKCQLCDKSFGLAYLLRDHLNTHTGERPHRCSECHKSFPWLSSLLVHQKIHARKRQGLNQPLSLPLTPQRGRGRARGGRGRRGSRWASVLPRWEGGESMLPPSLPAYSGQISREQDWHRKTVQHQQDSLLTPHLDISDQWQEQQWQTKVHERVLPQQKQPMASETQATVQYKESYSRQADGTAAWGLHTPPVTAHSDTPLDKQQQNLSWASRSVPASHSALQQDEDHSEGSEKATTVWALKRTPTVAHDLLDKPADGQKEQQQQQQHVFLADTPTLTAASPPADQYEVSPHFGQRATASGSPAPPIKPQTLSAPENLGGGPKQNHALERVSTCISTKSTQTIVAIQKTESPEGEETAVQGLPTSPAAPQTLSPADSCASKQQQRSVETNPQSTAKPQTPDPLSPPQSCHSDAAEPLDPPPQNSCPTLQTAASEEPPSSQTLPPAQAAHPAKSQASDDAPGCAALPFAPNPLLQCMICGCSLPRELDLHIHYMQHAQSET